MATCRLCGGTGPDSSMAKYSTRASAHVQCVLERPGRNFARFIAKVINLNDFPILLLKGEVAKLEALRDAFRMRNYPEPYAQICEDMIKQAEKPQ